MLTKFMVRFSLWFASPQAVLQVFILTTLWSIVEIAFPHLDPNGFTFLYVCTVWGVQTQNILAYAATLSADESRKTQEMLMEQNEKIEQLVKVNVHQNEVIVEMVKAMVSMQRQLDAKVEDIADDIDDIKGDV